MGVLSLTASDTKSGDVVEAEVVPIQHAFESAVHVFGHFPENLPIMRTKKGPEGTWFEVTEEVL